MARCEDCIYYDLDNDGEVICLRSRYTQEQQKLYGRGACNEQEKTTRVWQTWGELT